MKDMLDDKMASKALNKMNKFSCFVWIWFSYFFLVSTTSLLEFFIFLNLKLNYLKIKIK